MALANEKQGIGRSWADKFSLPSPLHGLSKVQLLSSNLSTCVPSKCSWYMTYWVSSYSLWSYEALIHFSCFTSLFPGQVWPWNQGHLLQIQFHHHRILLLWQITSASSPRCTYSKKITPAQDNLGIKRLRLLEVYKNSPYLWGSNFIYSLIFPFHI